MDKLKPYLSFAGRATRLSYWRVSLLGGVLLLVPVMIGVTLAVVIGQAAGVVAVLALPVFVALVAVAVRRLHDRNKSGWWLLLLWGLPTILSTWVDAQGETNESPAVIFAALASLSLSLWSFVEIGLLSGTKGPNRYGADPTEPSPAEVFG